jgi:hypothetical protein
MSALPLSLAAPVVEHGVIDLRSRAMSVLTWIAAGCWLASTAAAAWVTFEGLRVGFL